MKKAILCLIAILTLSLCVFVGCDGKVPQKPEGTDLEFWIAEDVKEVDFSEYNEIIGHFGASEYYGKGYAPAGYNEDGFAIDPPYYVKYLISAYPDYSDGGQYVTCIRITDPSVTVYGINCNSSFAQFTEAMTGNGFEVTLDEYPQSSRISAYIGGKAWIHIIKNASGQELVIGVTVTNKHNIVF